jgi:hypothetical protein
MRLPAVGGGAPVGSHGQRPTIRRARHAEPTTTDRPEETEMRRALMSSQNIATYSEDMTRSANAEFGNIGARRRRYLRRVAGRL